MAAVAGGDAVAPGGCGRGGVGRRGARAPARRGAASGGGGGGGPRGAVVAGDGGGTRLHRRGIPEPDPVGELPDVSGVAGGRALRRAAARSGGGRAARSLPECGTGVGGGGRRVGRWRWRGGRWLVLARWG